MLVLFDVFFEHIPRNVLPMQIEWSNRSRLRGRSLQRRSPRKARRDLKKYRKRCSELHCLIAEKRLYNYYSPVRNYRIHRLSVFFGSHAMIIQNIRLLTFSPAAQSCTLIKLYVINFYGFIMFFLRRGPPAQRADNFKVILCTLKTYKAYGVQSFKRSHIR